MRQGNQEPLHDFAEALRVEEERIQQGTLPHWHYKRAGFYYEQLYRYYQIFHSSQIKVCIYEDFIATPQATLCDIFRFLGVDSAFSADISKKYNVSGVPRNALFNTFLHKQTAVKSMLKMLVPPEWRTRIRMHMHRKLRFDPDVRHELLQVYRDDILRLQDLLQRDLSIWMEP
jgi:hypothetical protein